MSLPKKQKLTKKQSLFLFLFSTFFFIIEKKIKNKKKHLQPKKYS